MALFDIILTVGDYFLSFIYYIFGSPVSTITTTFFGGDISYIRCFSGRYATVVGIDAPLLKTVFDGLSDILLQPFAYLGFDTADAPLVVSFFIMLSWYIILVGFVKLIINIIK